MNEGPLVSILMTSYNREKYIGAAIESVLASTYTNFELIIVDDGSVDKTVAIARSYEQKDNRIKVYINEKNLGDYPNRNKAASYAKGEYLKYLDSDDLIYKYGLQGFVDFMEMDKEVALGISYKRNVTETPFPIIMKPAESVRYHFFKDGFLDCAPTGTIIRRACFEATGGFSGRRMVGDCEFGIKIASQYKVMLVPPGLFFWRNHGDQEVFYGIDNGLYGKQFEEVLEERFSAMSKEVLTREEQHKILTDIKRTNKIVSFKKILKKIIKPGK